MSENHIRGISVTLSDLDKVMCEFDQWSKGYEVRSVLYEMRNTLSHEQRQRIAVEIAHVRTMLRSIRDRLELPVTVRSADRSIVSFCAVLWSSLVELEGRRLRRYGEVPPGLAEYLDPKVATLSERLQSIADIVAGSGSR
jgi:hypothetical protein